MLTALARFFRISLSKGSNIIPIGDEIEHARNYLTIQKMRYKNKFSADISVEPGVEKLYTIKLIIQPILENAFEHGMKNVLEPKLFIRFEARLGEWNVCIDDNGTEFSPVELSELQQKLDSTDTQMETTALINIHRRLRYHFGPESGLRLSRTPAGSLQVQLHIVKEE